MMGKPSSKQSKINSRSTLPSMDQPRKSDHVKHLTSVKQEQPHLSGAYIRSLVKHLTSVKTKDKSPESVNSNRESFSRNNHIQESPPPPSAPHKKQIRRRQHTSKPYQERLLNMAEARREIVTALKFHRAAMKQRETAGNYHNQPPPETIAAAGNGGGATGGGATAMGVGLYNGYLESYSSLSSSSPSVPCYWSLSPPSIQENLDFTLPNQTLGLNLNFQDFQNLDTNLYYNNNNPLSNYAVSSLSASSSSSSSSWSPCNSSSAAVSLAVEEVVKREEVVAVGVTMTTSSAITSTATTSTTTTSSSSCSGSLHYAMDDEGIEEIRSLGEQLQIEWSDNMNLMMSARWLKFLETIEGEQEFGKFDDQVNLPFDQVLEFPTCMDIGESEGMNEEWLA